MIRNVVFDMGGVLIRWEPEEFMNCLEVAPEDRALLWAEVFRSVEWVMRDRGTMEEEAAVASICRRLPARLHETASALVRDWWKFCLKPMEGMAQLLEELKGLGLGLYVLSNATDKVRGYFDRIPGAGRFDGKIFSAEWKELKPEREIYQTLLTQYGLKAEECFFVDDMPANIEGAAFAGIRGAIFRGDTARLRRELAAAGVPVKQL